MKVSRDRQQEKPRESTEKQSNPNRFVEKHVGTATLVSFDVSDELLVQSCISSRRPHVHLPGKFCTVVCCFFRLA